MRTQAFQERRYLLAGNLQSRRFSNGLKQKQTVLYDELQSEQLTKQIQKFEDTYSDKVNIDRYDIEGYLDRFVEAQREIQHQEQDSSDYPGVDAISAIKRKYLVVINDLKSFSEKAADLLKIKNDKIEVEIGNISRKIRKLESNEKEQQIDPTKISDIV